MDWKAIQSRIEKLKTRPVDINLSVDLSDIYEACLEYTVLLEKFLTLDALDPKVDAQTLTAIETTLEHIAWHTRSSRKNMSTLISDAHRKGIEGADISQK
ncbi:hypothetical protein FJZ31_06260 [Candidatus Poribacteria bacterium]|nr:hypothetical protein [Candidatus Poribacteria bacterium]